MDNIQVLSIAISPDCLEGKRMKDKWDSGFRVLRIMAEEIDALQEFPFPEDNWLMYDARREVDCTI